MTRSRLANFIFGILAGLCLGAGFATTLSHQTIAHAQQTVQDQAAAIADLKQDASNLDDQIEALEAELALHKTMLTFWMGKAQAAEADPAAQLLAQSGHVMNEAQCRAWIGVLNVPQHLPQSPTIATVLYESDRRSLHVSLLPLPGAPRISLDANSQLAPRWVIPGKIQPLMIGESRHAMYFYFDAGSSQWQGPFAPQRVAQ